jgi:hypothetical protein
MGGVEAGIKLLEICEELHAVMFGDAQGEVLK